jgi:hypothetical protein
MKTSKTEIWNRTVHYQYVKNTEQYNKPNYVALMDPMAVLRRRLFDHSSSPWEGEILSLKGAHVHRRRVH